MKLKKGINIGGYLSQCIHQAEHYDKFFKEADIKQIQEWGFDHIRLPFDYNIIQSEDGEIIPEGVERLRENVLWCQMHGLNIILDLHKASGYDFNYAGYSTKNSLFNNEELVMRFISLWEIMAKEFGIYSNVVFELLNEVVESENSAPWNALINRAVRAIRDYAAGSEALGIQGEAIKRAKTEAVDIEFTRELVSAAITAANKAGVPLYCGEFGVIDQAPVEDSLRWLEDTLTVFRENNIGHAIWTYKEMDFGLIDDHYAPIKEPMIRALTQ